MAPLPAEWEIRQETSVSFEEHGLIPIFFTTNSRLSLSALRDSGALREDPMPARFKDYDECVEDQPSVLPSRFDCTNWALLAAYAAGERIGGAILARDCPEFDLLEGRTDLVHIVDIRLAPAFRGQGIGKSLVQACAAFAREHGCNELRVETQDINVAACRFYAACGLNLMSIEEHAYGPDIDEARLIWRIRL